MVDYTNFETYLFLSPKKFIILVIRETNEKIYENELLLDAKSKDLDLDKLDHFLNDNIFKIEKFLNDFVKNIHLIIDCEFFFSVNMSIKKNNYGELLTTSNINYVLNEAKHYCSDTLSNRKLIHLLIDNYLIDGKSYSNFPQNLKCNYFSLDINFICLPLNYVRKIEDTINKYQISLNRLISMKYIENYFSSENLPLNEMAQKIIDGYNLNEVVLTSKKVKNKSFFEKFFHFFN